MARWQQLTYKFQVNSLNRTSLFCHEWTPNNITIVKSGITNAEYTQDSRWQGPKPINWNKPCLTLEIMLQLHASSNATQAQSIHQDTTFYHQPRHKGFDLLPSDGYQIRFFNIQQKCELPAMNHRVQIWATHFTLFWLLLSDWLCLQYNKWPAIYHIYSWSFSIFRCFKEDLK